MHFQNYTTSRRLVGSSSVHSRQSDCKTLGWPRSRSSLSGCSLLAVGPRAAILLSGHITSASTQHTTHHTSHIGHCNEHLHTFSLQLTIHMHVLCCWASCEAGGGWSLCCRCVPWQPAVKWTPAVMDNSKNGRIETSWGMWKLNFWGY